MTDRPTFADFSARLIERIGASAAALSEKDEAFTELALALFQLQFLHVPVYRSYCLSKGASPEQVAHWKQIPAMPTRGFKEFELSSLPATERSRVFRSSGTTGQRRSCHFHSAASLRVYEASLLPWFRIHLLEELASGAVPAKLLILTPSPDEVPDSSLVHMVETVRRSFPFCGTQILGFNEGEAGWSVDLQAAVLALQGAIGSGQPALMLGTAFSFIHLIDYLQERHQRFQLPEGSRVMETGGYKGRSRVVSKGQLHKMISDQFGIPDHQIVAEYGMSELSSQAYDRVAGSLSGGRPTDGHPSEARRFCFPPWARVQVVSAETGREVAEGQSGLIRVVDLANVYSLLAVQTEDLGVRRGSGFELVGRVANAEPRGCSLMTWNGLA